MRSRGIALIVLVLAACFLALPASAFAVDPAPRIAVVYSRISHEATMPPIAPGATEPIELGGPLYDARVQGVEDLLRLEFGDSAVTRIGDAELESLAALEAYDVVVLTRNIAATRTARETLRTYVVRGGALVCSFGTGRWDYDAAGRGYYPLVYLTGTSLWEWGELSEIMQVGFVNDPPMIAGFHIENHPGAGAHPILQKTMDDLGVSSIDMTASISDCSELVRTLPPAASVTPLLMYDHATLRHPDGTRQAVSGSLAGWTSEYNMGRVVYFGFQLHDLVRGDGVTDTAYASANTQRQAARLFVNSVAWAARTEDYGVVLKDPRLYLSGSFTNGRVRVTHRVANAGTVQLRGRMGVKLYDPRGRLFYSTELQRGSMTIWPTSSTTLDWVIRIGTPAKGRWTARCTYVYWDHFRGGEAVATRDLVFTSNGKTLKVTAAPGQWVSGALPSPGPAYTGADRYVVAASVAGAGWPGGSAGAMLATGLRPADALAAAPLAGALDVPLLLTKPGALDPSVRARIVALARGRSSFTVYAIGTKAAVGDAAVAAAVAAVRAAGVKGAVRVERLQGPDDPSLAAAVARRVGAPATGPFAQTAFIVNAATYADALSIAPLAARNRVPILFVTYGGVPGSTAQALAALGIRHTVLVGGPGSVTPAVEQWLESNGYRVADQPDNSANSDTRLWGATRYDVSAWAVRYGSEYGGMDAAAVGITSGLKWPDALSAAPMLGRAAHPMLLLHGLEANLSPAPLQYLMDRRGTPLSLSFFGGPATVTPYVQGQAGAVAGL